jgi:TrmH family RNA methyltransferase
VGMARPNNIISTLKHPAVVAAREGIGQVGRQAATAFLADGHRLVSQAIRSGAPIESVFFLHPFAGAEDAALLERARDAGLACHLVTKGVFFRLLGLGYETSVGALAVVRRPASADAAQLARGDACVLVGEQIQDPRNVGVLVRTADAWKISCAVFTSGSADAYSRASVRSSTSSIFRVPLAIVSDLPACLGRLKANSVRIIGTSAHAELPCWEADLSAPCAIVLGNESAGLSEAVRKVCDEVVTIPMHGGAESLNVTVAGGIMLYERARQRGAAGCPVSGGPEGRLGPVDSARPDGL